MTTTHRLDAFVEALLAGVVIGASLLTLMHLVTL